MTCENTRIIHEINGLNHARQLKISPLVNNPG